MNIFLLTENCHQVVSNQEGWRPPIPPVNWVNFDPTPTRTSSNLKPTTIEKRETMGDSMIKGDDPSNIRRKSMFVADFMKREVSESHLDLTYSHHHTKKRKHVFTAVTIQMTFIIVYGARKNNCVYS